METVDQTCSLLIIDASTEILDLLRLVLGERVFEVFTASTQEEATELLTSCGRGIDIILADDETVSTAFLRQVVEFAPDAKACLMTGGDPLQAEVGSCDFDVARVFSKPFRSLSGLASELQSLACRLQVVC